jgi:hypothetical protein
MNINFHNLRIKKKIVFLKNFFHLLYYYVHFFSLVINGNCAPGLTLIFEYFPIYWGVSSSEINQYFMQNLKENANFITILNKDLCFRCSRMVCRR